MRRIIMEWDVSKNLEIADTSDYAKDISSRAFNASGLGNHALSVKSYYKHKETKDIDLRSLGRATLSSED